MSKHNKFNPGSNVPNISTSTKEVNTTIVPNIAPPVAKNVVLVENNNIVTPIVFIPAEIHNKINYFCNKMRGTEWSGELFYEVEGEFNKNLKLTIKDILLLNLGGTTSTEYDNDDMDIASFTFERQLINCQRGLIHSHHSMGAFFSGTDTNTLLDQGQDRIHFLSLIVDDNSTYQAALTVKLEIENVVKTISHKKHTFQSFFNKLISGNSDNEEDTVITSTQIQYKKCDIVYENAELIKDWDDAINNVKEKVKKIPVHTSLGFNHDDWKLPISWEDTANLRGGSLQANGFIRTVPDMVKNGEPVVVKVTKNSEPSADITTKPVNSTVTMTSETLVKEGDLSMLVTEDVLLLESLTQEILDKLLLGTIFPVLVRENKEVFYQNNIKLQLQYFATEEHYENAINPLVDVLFESLIEDFETEADESYITSTLYHEDDIQSYASLRIMEIMSVYASQGYVKTLIDAVSRYNIYNYDWNE